MLRAILNKSWRQHPTKQQLYCYLPPVMKSIKIRRTRHAGHCWRRRDELVLVMYSCRPLYMDEQRLDVQLKHDQKICRTLTHDIRKHWTAVSTLLGLINSVYRDLQHWSFRSQSGVADSISSGGDHGIHCWW